MCARLRFPLHRSSLGKDDVDTTQIKKESQGRLYGGMRKMEQWA